MYKSVKISRYNFSWSQYRVCQNILWRVDPLLGNGCEISNYTTAIVNWWYQQQACFHDKNRTVTEEQCFLCSSCQEVISKGQQQFSSQWVGWRVSDWVSTTTLQSWAVAVKSWWLTPGTVLGPRGRRTSAIGSHYQKTVEDTAGWEDLSVDCSEL
jgi:hypothetical protein